MTDTPTADGLEKRLRHARITAINDDLSERETEKRARHISRTEVMAEAADALAKARVALEAVQFIEYMDGNIGTRCPICGGRTEHGMSCNIGAALEAMK